MLPAAVAAVSTLFYYGGRANQLADRAKFFNKEAYNFGGEPQAFIGYTLWLVTEFLFLVLLLTCTGLAIKVSWPELCIRERRRLKVALPVIAMVLAVVVYTQGTPVLTPEYTRKLATLIATELDGMSTRFLNLTSPLLGIALLAGGLAGCACGRPLRSLRTLARRQAELRFLLFAFSALLVCGVLEVYTFHRIPMALLSEDSLKQPMVETAAVIAVMAGTLHSALLFAIFAPAAWNLRALARTEARRRYPGSPTRQEKWLLRHAGSALLLADAKAIVSFVGPAVTSVVGYFLAIRA